MWWGEDDQQENLDFDKGGKKDESHRGACRDENGGTDGDLDMSE